MKKSIKYAGIAAATLLAVAPVAAPVVSQADAVTDASSVKPTDQSEQDKAVTAFGNQFQDKTAKTVAAGKVQLGTVNAEEFATKDAALITGDASDVALLNSKGTAQVNVSAKYGNTSITTNNDLYKILNDTTYPEVVFTITLSYNNLNGVAQSKTYSVTATRDTDTTSEMTQANVSFTTPVNVSLNSTTTATTLDVSNDATVKDQDGNSVLTDTEYVAAKPVFYDTYKAAMKVADGHTADATAATNVGPNANVNGGQTSFLKAGTYYQVITFQADKSSALQSFLAAYSKNPSAYTVSVNGSNAAAGYDFGYNSTTNTLSFVRAINVSNSTDKWTVSDTTGVVTTKSDHSVYTLKDADNNTIVNRGLAANTAWKTDKVRVNQDGVKQYRVATNEWINADDVNYGETVTSNGLTDIKAASGVATLTKPAGYVMSLFGDDGNVLDRGLASGTAWRVDKTAKDAAGNTYYRVATGEWLQAGEGVSFK
ncbi:hypothetical protein EGT49_08580 [Companilactobacillus suantsaicola]|uniref:Surface layer protein A domain-containing protein n=1 Tax=Companilactobacillus suantsaicola TaxID=2487723 RepID=A0A4Z0JHU6_9LACO|nr:hypothetical protein [Companilactobacillus suantsaicola]TGD22561.1 hypothetical protein EGT49_08580 [Companilactobacillus suantsaicola]